MLRADVHHRGVRQRVVNQLTHLLFSIAAVIAAVASIVSALLSLRNAAKLDQVHQQTNSLAQRNEAIARALGAKEGAEQERSK